VYYQANIFVETATFENFPAAVRVYW